MGQRQLQIDTEGQNDEGCIDLFGIAPPSEVPVGAPLSAEAVTEWPGADERLAFSGMERWQETEYPAQYVTIS